MQTSQTKNRHKRYKMGEMPGEIGTQSKAYMLEKGILRPMREIYGMNMPVSDNSIKIRKRCAKGYKKAQIERAQRSTKLKRRQFEENQ